MVCPTGMGLGEALRNTEYGALSFMSQIRPFQGLGLSAKGRYPPALSAPPPFQRKGALALRHAALETPKQIP